MNAFEASGRPRQPRVRRDCECSRATTTRALAERAPAERNENERGTLVIFIPRGGRIYAAAPSSSLPPTYLTTKGRQRAGVENHDEVNSLRDSSCALTSCACPGRQSWSPGHRSSVSSHYPSSTSTRRHSGPRTDLKGPRPTSLFSRIRQDPSTVHTSTTDLKNDKK